MKQVVLGRMEFVETLLDYISGHFYFGVTPETNSLDTIHFRLISFRVIRNNTGKKKFKITIPLGEGLMNIRNTVYLSAICLFLLVLLHPFPASADSLDNWHIRNSVPGGYTLNAVAYGNGMFIAVGSGGTILSSPDGTNWMPRASGTLHDLKGITFGNGLFVAVGGTWDSFGFPRGKVIITSPDGITWTPRFNSSGLDLVSVAYGNGSFVAGGSLESVFISQDGITWSNTSPIINFTWHGINSIIWGDGIFVAGSGPFIMTSTDGINWTERPIGVNTADVQGLAHGGNKFVAVGQDINTSGPVALISPDGITWSALTIETSYGFSGVTFGNNTFVGVGTRGADHFSMVSSPDGLNWTGRQSGITESLSGVTYGNSTFVAVGSNGLIIQSDALIEVVGVPTLSEWGMILLVFCCGIAAIRSFAKLQISEAD